MNNKILFGIVATMIIPMFFSIGYSEKIEGYDTIKEKMLPKCLEFNEAGSMDMLRNHDMQLYLMCLDFMLEDGIKIKPH